MIYTVNYTISNSYFQHDDKVAEIEPKSDAADNQLIAPAMQPNPLGHQLAADGRDHNVIFEALQTITQQQVKQILAPLMDQLASKQQVSKFDFFFV